MYQSFGFPLEITEDLAREKKIEFKEKHLLDLQELIRASENNKEKHFVRDTP